MTNTLPKLEPCDGCETPTNRTNEDGTPFCADCVAACERNLKAQNDLVSVLEPVVKAWAKRWAATGYPLDDLTATIMDLNAIVPGPVEWVQAVEPVA
jgi:hypothetical protein